MSDQNKALVRRAIEDVWNGGKFALVDEFVSRDIVVHASTPDAEIHGPEGIKQFYAALHAAFPDIRFMIEDQIAGGDRVVTRWTARATHTGIYRGIATTGKQFHVAGIDIDRIVDGTVVECWPLIDELGLLHQLGVFPAPGQTG